MISSENLFQHFATQDTCKYLQHVIVFGCNCTINEVLYNLLKVVDTPEAILKFHLRVCHENCLRRALTMISRVWWKSVLAKMSRTQFRQRYILIDSWMDTCRILYVDSRLEAQVHMGAHCSF